MKRTLHQAYKLLIIALLLSPLAMIAQVEKNILPASLLFQALRPIRYQCI